MNWNKYTVKSGDTLSGIAEKSSCSLAFLIRINTQIDDPHKIVPGQVINMPQWFVEDGPAPVPIDMILHCPSCGMQHIDVAEQEIVEQVPLRSMFDIGGATHTMRATVVNPDRWLNPPHRSHLCGNCGCIWRPADVPTNGVRRIDTAGKNDTFFFRCDDVNLPITDLGLASLLKLHEAYLVENPYCYFELAYTRKTAWMVWICTNSHEADVNRRVITTGQGQTIVEACAAALRSMR